MTEMPWQPAPLQFPDVETIVPAALRTLLTSRGVTGVYVGRNVPAERPARMVCVTRDGGNASGSRDRARVRIRVWDTTDAAANDLARLIVALAPLMADGAPVLRVQNLSGPTDVPEPSGTPCRYLLFQIDTRGVPA